MIRLVNLEHAAATDSLRPPSPLDLQAHAYKDWLHLNVFAPEHGVVAVLNASLHGDPIAATSLGVGTMIVSWPGEPLASAVEVRPQSAVEVGGAAIGVGDTARLALGDGAWFLRAAGRATDRHGSDVQLDVAGWPSCEPIQVETTVPFGAGWISWRAAPRLRLEGRMCLAGREIGLDAAVGYHDHNWGRWYWGDDIGWRWGVFPLAGEEVTLVVAHRTDRAHRRGRPSGWLQAGARVRDYPAGTVTIDYRGRRDVPPLRLPGAMAALRSDRQQPDLPCRVVARVEDGFDSAVVDFDVADAVQVIAAEPSRPGQTFIHELVGRFLLTGRIGGRPLSGEGLGVFEHVD